MTEELIRPIDADTAKAIEEISKLGPKVVGAGTDLGAYAGQVIGRVPHDLVGLLIGDWLTHKRVRRWAGLCEETKRILERRGAF
jgi:hypothetical protein